MKLKTNWIKILLAAVVIAAVCAGVYFFLPKILSAAGFFVSLFLPFILGYLFSKLVNPLADFLQKKLKIPRGLSAILVIVLTIGILGGILTAVIWKIIDEARNLYTQIPSIYSDAQSWWGEFSNKWSSLYYGLPDNIQAALSGISESFSEKTAAFINRYSSPVVDHASNIAKSLPGIFIGIIVFILSTYFMVTDHKKVSQTVNKLVGKRFEDRITVIKTESKKYLGGYIRAQGIIMTVVFFVMLAEFTVLNVSYALLIALGTAFLDALPFFGSGLVLWPWALVSFLGGDIKRGIGLVVVYISVAVTRHLIEPKLVSSRIGVNPILTLMSMYVGYRLISVGGIILGPVILMLLISFYKAGVFDGIIEAVKFAGLFIKKRLRAFKNYVIELTKE